MGIMAPVAVPLGNRLMGSDILWRVDHGIMATGTEGAVIEWSFQKFFIFCTMQGMASCT